MSASVGGRRREAVAASRPRERAFHEKVRAGFLELARRSPERFAVIDATEAPQLVADRVAAVDLRTTRRTPAGTGSDGLDVSLLAPRENPSLFGHEQALERLQSRVAKWPPAARMAAWVAPPGIGKATLAYRLGRRVLATGAAIGDPNDRDSPLFRRVAHGSEPDLLVLEPTAHPRSGKLRHEITVDQVRAVTAALHETARGARRASGRRRYRRCLEQRSSERLLEALGGATGRGRAASRLPRAGPHSAHAALTLHQAAAGASR